MKIESLLDDHELRSTVWLKIKAHLEEKLAERRAYNDGLTLTEVETAAVRGEIARIKHLLRIG